jgi:hypothetical protein
MMRGAGWQMERLRFDLPVGREERSSPMIDTSSPSRIVPKEEVRTLLKGNYFAEIEPHIGVQIVLPPGTRLLVVAPHTTKEKGDVGEIHLVNGFCDISIETQQSTYMRSLGTYRFLAGISLEASREMATAMYIVRFKADFNRLRSGHPDMPKYRAWARQLADGLRDQFDEQLIWQRTRDDFLLRRGLGIIENEGI